MRTREEIKTDLCNSSPDFRPSAEKIIAEMLLDIRTLLQESTKE